MKTEKKEARKKTAMKTEKKTEKKTMLKLLNPKKKKKKRVVKKVRRVSNYLEVEMIVCSNMKKRKLRLLAKRSAMHLRRILC